MSIQPPQQPSAIREERIALFEALSDLVPCAVFFARDDGFRYVNRGAEVLTGMSREQLLGRRWDEVFDLDSLPENLRAGFPSRLASRPPHRAQVRLCTRRGSCRWVDLAATQVRLGGRPLVAVVAFDISDRVAAEQTARRLADRTRQLLDATLDGFILADREGRILEVNPAYCSLVGYDEEALLRMNIRDVECSLSPDEIEERIRLMVRDRSARFETRHRAKDGREIPLDVSITILDSDHGPLVAAFVRDRSREAAARAALESSEAQYRRIVETTQEGVWVLDEDDRTTFVNARMAAMLGAGVEDVIGRSIFEFVPESEREKARTGLARRRRGIAERHEFLFRRTDGSDLWAVLACDPFFDETGRYQGLLAMVQDVTAQRRIQEAARRQEASLWALFESSPSGIVALDLRDRVVSVNSAFCRLFGYGPDEVVGRNIHDLIAPEALLEEAIGFSALAREKTIHRERTRRRRKDGSLVEVEVTGFPIVLDGEVVGIYGIYVDNTEQRRLEEHLARRQRIESLGTLASGIAHDLNNVLTPITMAVDLLRPLLQDPKARRLLDTLETSATRGSEITRQVLTFARGLEGSGETTPVKHLIRETVDLVRETFPKTIEIEVDVPRDLGAVQGHATQLHQVLLNLCVNARDAMPRGGTLRVLAADVELDPAFVQEHPDARPGPYVHIRVQDTGVGIPRTILDRIFDPFFTTKEPGKGTGLGLATASSIVRSHGGFIEVQSEPGRGSVFDVYLPRAGSESNAGASDALVPEIRGRGELVLVVDDEAGVREITREILELHGFRVALAENGIQGLEIFQARQQEIALVLTDMMMPGMDGPTLVQAIRSMGSRVPVMAMTGLLQQDFAQALEGMEIQGTLDKPYTAQRLLKAVRQALPA